MATTRVYLLARELGVKSAAIVQKCQAEGLDVKNHMAVISAGLAATIREWFSEGANITTVETAKKVDLAKVKVKKERKLKASATHKKVKKTQEAVTEEVVPEAPPEPAEHVEPAAEPEDEAPVDEVPGPTVVEEAPELVEEPAPVLPAGPMLEKPEPARLTGPQVVRVEEPEPLEPPRSKASKESW